ncbi:MAG: hypothetical protein ACJAUP_000100 [Cellvibrionaceae bacterium]|jgi:hypothetical protein
MKKSHSLLPCEERERESLFKLTTYLQANLTGKLLTLLTIKVYEYKLGFLLKKIDGDI